MTVNIINKIKNLSPGLQLLVALLPSLLFIVLFIFLVLLPKYKTINELGTKITKLNQEIADSEAKVKKLDMLIAENKMLKAKLAKLQEQLPEEKEVSVLLKQISELGLQSGLEILLWKPEAKKANPENLYVEIPVKVQVQTGYHNLGIFFSHVSRLPRLVNISDIDLRVKEKKGKESGGLIFADFTAHTFASVSPEDAAAAAEKAKDGKGPKEKKEKKE
ncbi:MAG: type 4a pilus biogenesis protein PilO [Nitrospirae bacterium]|nr:type 4a pilus biogenesis protein PilO [Nitrospirota bacterium]